MTCVRPDRHVAPLPRSSDPKPRGAGVHEEASALDLPRNCGDGECGDLGVAHLRRSTRRSSAASFRDAAALAQSWGHTLRAARSSKGHGRYRRLSAHFFPRLDAHALASFGGGDHWNLRVVAHGPAAPDYPRWHESGSDFCRYRSRVIACVPASCSGALRARGSSRCVRRVLLTFLVGRKAKSCEPSVCRVWLVWLARVHLGAGCALDAARPRRSGRSWATSRSTQGAESRIGGGFFRGSSGMFGAPWRCLGDRPPSHFGLRSCRGPERGPLALAIWLSSRHFLAGSGD